MMKDIKSAVVTFIHTSGEDEEVIYTPLIPIGMVALASFLEKHGIKTQVINLELERSLDPHFDLVEYLKQDDRVLFCLNLHWHTQSAKVIQLSRLIKDAVPHSKIILGGFTASYFSGEILEVCDEIDFVVSGESEEPLLKLVSEIQSGRGDFTQISNLVWKNKGDVVVNPEKYNTPQEVMDELEFGNLNLLKNHEYYLKIDPWNRKKNLLSNDQPTFYYNCGRGCPVNCSFCSGSCVSQRIINNRTDVIFISHDSVIRELKRINRQYGIKFWHTCFDPFPDQDYYIELFQKIRGEGLELSSGFECWALPSKKFIDEFSKTFNLRHSKLQISPETGSNYVRKRNKGYYYSNADLLNTLEMIHQKNIHMSVFFSAGLAFEKTADVKKTLQLIQLIRKKFKKIDIVACSIEMEPGAPWYLSPEQYGIRVERKKFVDFYKRICPTSLGYRTGEFSSGEIKKIANAYNRYNQELLDCEMQPHS